MANGLGFLRRRTLLGFSICLVALGLLAPAGAAAHVTSVTSCESISSAGTYRLDAMIVPDFGSCFSVTAAHVTLDLNGQAIIGDSGPWPFETFGIALGAESDHVVGPGTITGFTGAGVLIGSADAVDGVTAEHNASGLEILGHANSVRGVVASQNRYGIVADRSSSANTIIGNSATANSFFDALDGNGQCLSNDWNGNTLRTVAPGCIR